MDKILTFQKSFLKAIQSDEVNDVESFDFEPCGSLSFKEALEVYRNNFYQNLKDSLENTYEACCKLIERELFTNLAYNFINQNPHRSHNVVGYGKSFPEFLKKSKIQKTFPFLFELACLERLVEEIFFEESSYSDGVDFSRLPKGQFLSLGRYKSMEINYPVHQVWMSLLYREEEIMDMDGKHLLLLFRNKETIFFKILDKKYNLILSAWQYSGIPSELMTDTYGEDDPLRTQRELAKVFSDHQGFSFY